MSEKKEGVLNIYQKLAELKKEVNQLDKDGKGYTGEYVTASLIYTRINPILEKLKLVLKPNIKEETIKYDRYQYEACTEKTNKNNEVTKEKKTKVDYVIYGEIEFRLVNTDNPDEFIIYNWAMFGQQDDPAKAYGSALTYAERYLLLKLLGVPTDETDPEFLSAGKKNITLQEAFEFYNIAGKNGFTFEDISVLLASRYKINDIQYIEISGYEGALSTIINHPELIRDYIESQKEFLKKIGG